MKIALNLAYIGLLVLPITAQNETCNQICPGEKRVPKNFLDFKTNTNDCSADLSEITTTDNMRKFERCCNVKNACYHVCGITNSKCETEYKECRDDQCENETTCISELDSAMNNPKKFKCHYEKAQSTTCACVRIEASNRRMEALLEFHDMYEVDLDLVPEVDFWKETWVSDELWEFISMIIEYRINREALGLNDNNLMNDGTKGKATNAKGESYSEL